MNRSIISFCFTITLLLSSVVNSSKAGLVSAPDTTSQKSVTGDTVTQNKPTVPNVTKTTNPSDSASGFIEWISSHDGLWGLLALIITIGGGVLTYWRKRRSKPKVEIDTRDARHRYLDYLIATHQHLPVAGFETNLRVPIPLEKVFVTLHARMAELERFREDGNAGREMVMDRSVTVQEALQFALGKKYDGVVILGNPGAGKTTLAKYFVLCFATRRPKPISISRKNFSRFCSFCAKSIRKNPCSKIFCRLWKSLSSI